MKHINTYSTHCGRNGQSFEINVDGIYSYHLTFRCPCIVSIFLLICF